VEQRNTRLHVFLDCTDRVGHGQPVQYPLQSGDLHANVRVAGTELSRERNTLNELCHG
jgi:hypothetical protein